MSDSEEKRDKLIYEIVVNRYNQEWQRTGDLDSKASSVTGFAGLLSALTAGVTEFFSSTSYQMLFLVPLALLIVSAILGLLAYWTRTFSGINPERLIEKYCEKEQTEVLRTYVATISESTLRNSRINDRKVSFIRGAFTFMVLAIVLFLVCAIINLLFI